MNKFTGSGTLPRNAVIVGAEKKVLRFTLATHLGQNKKTKRELWAYVPCVVFNPAAGTTRLLTENSHGLLIELEGRVNTSKFESKGVTKYSTEVVVDQGSLRVLTAQADAEPAPAEGQGT